ncbi:hypothetical protein GCM10007921_15640 [Tritonibacter mobilis]|nr:hypothetical protein GCM10007921_15640 [Tritonibacter mobilis]
MTQARLPAGGIHLGGGLHVGAAAKLHTTKGKAANLMTIQGGERGAGYMCHGAKTDTRPEGVQRRV